MSIIVGDILRVVAVMIWDDGGIAQNVFNAVISGTGGPYDEQDIVDDAEAWLDDMYANLTSKCPTELDGSEVRVYIYDGIDDDWDEVGSNVWGWNPSATDSQLPRGVAGLINAKTLDPDVSGKKYLAGFTELQNEEGLWAAATLASMVLFGVDWTTAFVGAVSTADWVPGVWSVVNTNLHPFSGTEIIPTIPAYQRRRKPGVGI